MVYQKKTKTMKTTTTTMVATLLDKGGFDPTVINGGVIHAYGSNARAGAGEWMVVEADESDGSFLRLDGTIAVVTNIDPEHLDHYGSFERVKDAFVDMFREEWRLERGAARPMPSTLTFNYPNVGALARFLETQLTIKAVEPVAAAPAPVAPAVAGPGADADLDTLSDDELEARLMARLEQTR